MKTGIDVLEADGFRELHPDPSHPVRVGLVTNQTAVDAHGQRTADILAHAPGIQLAAIFSPEHGIAGKLDTTEIGNSHDAATGAPIYSVYGDTDAKRRPTAAEMAGLDAIVYDIQDIGVRFYTYESTLGYFLEAAATAGKRSSCLTALIPIGGVYVQGPMADPGREVLCQLLADPRAPWNDGGRAGKNVQRRAGNWREIDGRCDGRLDARRLVRLYRQALD